jgi:hypothetical protein
VVWCEKTTWQQALVRWGESGRPENRIDSAQVLGQRQ